MMDLARVTRRKPHRKSRGGCLQCKERHAKCNEVYPRCRQCDRIKIACSFSLPSLTAAPLDADSLADLELLDHWHRSPVTGDLSDHAQRLHSDFVRPGFSRHYLLNSILGLTALQLFSEDRSQTKWYARAVAHQQTAIARARPHFQSLDETDHQALLGFSAFTSMYAVAEPFLRPRPQLHSLQTSPFDPVQELMQAFQFSRCTTAFVQQNFDTVFVAQSWLLIIPQVRDQDENLHDLDTSFPQAGPLVACIKRLAEGRQRASCLSAVLLVYRRIAALMQRPHDPDRGKVIWGWGLEVNETFLSMCSRRHAVAVAILAHFAVLMNFYQEHWCLSDWPAGLLSHIRGVLGDEWKCVIQWPCDVVFGVGKDAPRSAIHAGLAIDSVSMYFVSRC